MAEQLANLSKGDEKLMYRPDLWPANTEVSFGNVLYGYRATGTTSTGAVDVTYIVGIKILQYKGHVVLNGYETVMGFYYAGDNYVTPITYNEANGRVYFNVSAIYNNCAYEVWMLYSK